MTFEIHSLLFLGGGDCGGVEGRTCGRDDLDAGARNVGDGSKQLT